VVSHIDEPCWRRDGKDWASGEFARREFYNLDVAGLFHRLQPQAARTILRLQTVTLTWMLAECGLSLDAAWEAHSAVLLAFGSDSLVELFSATAVLLQFVPGAALSERKAGRLAAILLFVLAAVVSVLAIASLALRFRPETSLLGIGVAVAAVVGMPILAALKRREAQRSGNIALAADAVQSATCAYLAALTLLGLAINYAFHLPSLDSIAALACVPLLIKEGRSAWRGNICACC
jgi:divalent metal cation (Fe/Co/Zn/Cd) transporter